MKLLNMIWVVSALAACAKEPKATVSQTRENPSKILESSETHSSREVIRALGTMVEAQMVLASYQLKRCLDVEKNREEVRDACVLTWGAIGMEDPAATSAVRGLLSAATSRNLAIGMARRDSLVQRLTFGELLTLEIALSEAPPWTRLLTARSWLEKNKPQSQEEAGAIWRALRLPEQSTDPITTGISLVLALKLGQEFSRPILQAYCPGVPGVAATRCLRLLSAAAGQGKLTARSLNIDAEVAREALPDFARSFPDRARILNPLF